VCRRSFISPANLNSGCPNKLEPLMTLRTSNELVPGVLALNAGYDLPRLGFGSSVQLTSLTSRLCPTSSKDLAPLELFRDNPAMGTRVKTLHYTRVVGWEWFFSRRQQRN
jgi:hypothetical protein